MHRNTVIAKATGLGALDGEAEGRIIALACKNRLRIETIGRSVGDSLHAYTRELVEHGGDRVEYSQSSIQE